jgi:hypothetical protein
MDRDVSVEAVTSPAPKPANASVGNTRARDPNNSPYSALLFRKGFFPVLEVGKVAIVGRSATLPLIVTTSPSRPKPAA